MNYVKRLANWIWEGKYLFLFLIIIGLVFQLNKVNIGFKPVDNVRFFGLLLQLVGTVTIIYSLKDKLFLFKGHGLSKFFANYFRRFPLKQIPKNYNLKAEAGGYSFATAEARGVIRPKEELKDIIRYFDEEIQYIHKRLADTKNKLSNDIQDLTTKVENIKNNLSKEIIEAKELMKDSAVSNIWLESFGLSCIFLGLILGTVPDIVAITIW